ncbi:MAG: type II toxin-antitoxin system VapC family toxin [Burkholderiales bacterium]|nr:type II toxin-antitoxin system VapC family toxin [Burkholderiales bacterium]
MAFILDASVAIGWVVGRQATAYSRRLRLRAKREPYHAPTLWRSEVVNVIRSLTRRGAMSIEAGRTAIDILDRMQPVLHDTGLALSDLLDLAQRYSLTSYDACYLALALELRLPVACGDGPRQAAFKAAGIKLA